MAKFSIPDKLNLARLPTPIEYLPRLSARCSQKRAIRIYVKRDDTTHSIAGGNKIRKLEFLLAEALRRKAKTVVTCGGPQSNHARATAAICALLGLRCVLILRGPQQPMLGLQGNLLLDRVFGAEVRFVSEEQYANLPLVVSEVSEMLRVRDGVAPYFIPTGGSNEVGALGYVTAMTEIFEQCGKAGLPERVSSVVCANGSGGTHAGLLLGLSQDPLWEDACNVVSFNVAPGAADLARAVQSAMIGAVQRYRFPASVMPDEIRVIDGYVGPGYAQAEEGLFDFLVQTAREDGILFDPVYTGKALQGLVCELSKDGASELFGDEVLFLHTGGVPSLFAFSEQFSRAAQRGRG